MDFKEYLHIISREPLAEEVQIIDGIKHIPIDVIENKLDALFGGRWSFHIGMETFGKHEISAKGTLTYTHPVDETTINRSGTAAIGYRNELRLDYPALESRVLLNAAKKIGKWFGRDLNRDIDNEYISSDIKAVSKSIDPAYDILKEKIMNAANRNEAIALMDNSGAYKMALRYDVELIKKVNEKPLKN